MKRFSRGFGVNPWKGFHDRTKNQCLSVSSLHKTYLIDRFPVVVVILRVREDPGLRVFTILDYVKGRFTWIQDPIPSFLSPVT